MTEQLIREADALAGRLADASASARKSATGCDTRWMRYSSALCRATQRIYRRWESAGRPVVKGVTHY